MRELAYTAQMKQLDRAAIEGRGIDSLELMEHAAQAVASEVAALVEAAKTEGEKRTVGIFCGPGNNGGDGIAAARLLLEAGIPVRTFLVGERKKMTPDARAMEARLVQAGGCLEDFSPEDGEAAAWLSTCGCLVDALFGVGLKRPLEGAFLAAVARMNGSGRPVVACDLPSGVDGDTGEILGQAVQASVTVTFTCPKPGLYLGEGAGRAGSIRVVEIGIPDDLVQEVLASSSQQVEVMPSSMRCPLPPRPAAAHKGDFGKLFLLAGSEGYTGAPVLAARAALRTGAGLVFLGVPRSIYPIVAVKCEEAMPFPLPESYEDVLEKAGNCDVALLGPGLGRAPETEQMVLRLLEDLQCPVVLDADGINALVGHIDSLDKRRAPTVLTPHEGEFARLTGCALPIRDRLAAARAFAQEHGCTLVLKGRGTVTVAPTGRCWVCGTGNPGMAKGGSGDVLSGMIAALWGQKHLAGERWELAAQAVWYHGAAGDRCAQRLGEYAMLPSDLVETIPEILKENQRGKP